SYAINEKQYVAVMVGDGGAVPLSLPSFNGPKNYPNGRLLVFTLDGEAELKKNHLSPRPLQQPSVTLSAEEIENGRILYAANCAACHGTGTLSSGVLPDLKRSIAVTESELWEAIVMDGIYHERGMVSFAAAITTDESKMIRGYVGSEALRIAQEINENNAGYR
ncbi:MAG: PQQ-dependent dehydrogenase, methanol/ethanol family, partial [Porticoccaceae bacterium]|nr:PQQ-dependent dehydrogenase, methanol/ethanol family [Porticoccaceae bacterium]